MLLSEIKDCTRNIFWKVAGFGKTGAEKYILPTEIINKPFYIIQREGNPGLFSYVEVALLHTLYAVENGMIPVVNMKTYRNAYMEDNEVNKNNAWEQYFKQLFDVNIDVALSKEDSVVCAPENIDWNNRPGIKGVHSLKHLGFWGDIYKRYVRLSDEAELYCNNEYMSLLHGKETETIGVLVRGTDYKYAKGHYIQPEVKDVIARCSVVMKKKGFKYIYLASEEEQNVMMFERAFPGKVIINKRTYFDKYSFEKGIVLNDITLNRERDRYWRGMEYLSSVNMLSKCGGLCAGACGGSFAALYMNAGKYRYTYLYELGTV